MLLKISFLLLFGFLASVSAGHRVVCYWDGHSFWREGIAKVTVEEIKPALAYCTHLVYGFAEIDDDDYTVEPIDKKLDLDKGKGQYRLVTALKRSHPKIKVFLSVGGNRDTEDVEKYLKVLEKPSKRTKFINTATALVKEFGFDGLDLAWQFPPRNEKNEPYTFGSIWHKVKKTFGVGVDDKADEHREQFIALVRELRGVLKADNLQLSLGILPHINNTVYYGVKHLIPHVDMVNLWTVDFRTPLRAPKLADYSAPLHFMYGRLEHQNADHIVKHWIHQGAEPSKLNLGIPTHGNTWKLTKESPISGVPPLLADGPGEKGSYTKVEGQLAYFELCNKLVSPSNPKAPTSMLRRISDPTLRLGTYAYRLPEKNEDYGLWASFEEPESAIAKAAYAKSKGLGGVAILSLDWDDHKGICDGSKFPITRSAEHVL